MAKTYSLKYFQWQGRRGGKIGGKLSSARLTPEQRKERARQAAAVRWAKHKAAAAE